MPVLTRPLVLASGAIAAVALVAGAAVPAHADPIALSVSASAPLVTLPVGDGYRDVESLVVTASAAAAATVTVQRSGGGATTQTVALAAGTTSITIPTTGLAAGLYTATVGTADGASAAAAFTVETLHATLSKLTVQRSLSTVYPVQDGYRDSVVLTVTPVVAGPASAKVTGTATLSRAGRTAKRWTLQSGTNRLTWNGRVGGAVQAGRYTLTVMAKGPQGAARTVRTSVVVSAKRLVTRTTVVTKQASSALSRYQAYDAAGSGICGYSGPLVGCTGYTAANGASFSVITGGSLSIPKAVRASTAVAAPAVRVGVHATKLEGGAVWGSAAGSAHATGTLAKGTTAGKWLHWSGNPATASVFLALRDDSSLVVDRITFTYRYRALV